MWEHVLKQIVPPVKNGSKNSYERLNVLEKIEREANDVTKIFNAVRDLHDQLLHNRMDDKIPTAPARPVDYTPSVTELREEIRADIEKEYRNSPFVSWELDPQIQPLL
jgi:t-SNARE complex subunit (syntaxin)